MKITLYMDLKIMEFELPSEIMGSYSFDSNSKTDSKLINIEANNGTWYLYSTPDASVLNEDTPVINVPIVSNRFYNIKKDNKVYLIFISDSKSNNVMTYKYNQNINLIIGNDETCNIKYNNSNFTNKAMLTITSKDNQLLLNTITEDRVYKNNKIVKGQIEIAPGDKISSYGLNIIFLKDLFLINNPGNLFTIKEGEANILFQSFSITEKNQNIEIKDKELNPEETFFSKSPRLRRFIETKEIKLDPPPKSNTNEETPFLLTLGPMLTMGASSSMMLVNTFIRINNGQSTYADSWPQIVTSIAMLATTLLWPTITQIYSKHSKIKNKEELIQKYNNYLKEKEKELLNERALQKAILIENLIPLSECINMINSRITLFWNKRNDENDFLTIRVGIGNAKLDVDIKYPEEGFSIDEDELKKASDAIVEKYKYIEQVPIGYSLYDNAITAIMGVEEKSYNFVNNIILQLLTFYSYEDIKLVFFTSEENESYFEYGKYLKHTFSNDMHFRFFASNPESYHNLADYINMEINNRIQSLKNRDKNPFKPHYIIIIDNYEEIKKFEFVNTIAESKENLGFSIILIENRLSKLPSKCNNFISLTEQVSTILKNSYEKQEQISFTSEINSQINMMSVAKVLSNIPIEFGEGIKHLPDSISFLEMERVGKVEQLNILNRWKTNDPTVSLKAEIGVDELGNLMYLDLHEKYHGPHGLIAGTTGSGKSEFIITYVLSLAMNYSPEYVSFILIDYKGGGLAFAFENKMQGIVLPHLAGTITNLDKAEMDRTLVSIDSEAKRRQKIFNEARDKLGESTIDIYKYQTFYREGKVDEPLPHLFIICDEFAELKSQQPEFMDNLISIARIGRSLGVHLILATQKPSGVVNDQIWSNTKFRVCLKVQDESDSKEMLKRPEAAHITQAGRFYLQVGYDEVFALGQSGWCGAKYYPSNQIVKTVDKSINFIDDCGNFIKSIQDENKIKIVPQGEQLAAIMKNIIETAKTENLQVRKLWLDNIPGQIYVNEIIKKYNIQPIPYDVKAILGEYDAPEKQEQGIVEYSFLEDGNTIIYGIDSAEKEMLLTSIIYSTVINYTSQEINYYLIDFGSESLRKFSKFPHIGGMVFNGEEEKFNNLIKLIKNEMNRRKKIFADYGGEYKNYIKNNRERLPIIVIILNNYDSIYENNNTMYEWFPELVRDSERYGIVYIATANASNSINGKIATNFSNIYAFKVKDPSEYLTLFNSREKVSLRDIIGRGILKNNGLHQFQTASLVLEGQDENEYLNKVLEAISSRNPVIAKNIPTLPNIVRYDFVKDEIKNIANVPIGISKDELETVNFNFTLNTGTIISSNKITNTNEFIKSLVYEFRIMPNTDIIFVDGAKKLSEIKTISKFYYDDFGKMIDTITKYFNKFKEKNVQRHQILMIYGFDKAINSLEKKNLFEELVKSIKKTELSKIIIIDDASKLKTYAYESWYSSTFGNSDGIWVGKGIGEQNVFKIGMLKREFMVDLKNDYGMYISEGSPTIIKLIEFYKKEGEQDGK